MAVIFTMKNARTIDALCQFNVYRYTRVDPALDLDIETPCSLCIVPAPEPECETFDVTGTYEVLVEGDFLIQCWGAGAGAGRNGPGPDGTGGVGGGEFAESVIHLTAGSYTVNVGVGGVGTSAFNGNDGGDTWVVDDTTILAVGGKTNTTNTNAGIGGTGGIGDTTYDGGTGGTTNCEGGAGGGSSAGTASVGTNGSNNTGNPSGSTPGGTAPTGGGDGGAGGDENTSGTNGSAPGGGGGAGGGSSTKGGNGGNGRVIICPVA